MVSGRDTNFSSGNTALWTCGRSAAVMVHEQFDITSNAHLQGQLVVENKGACSPTLSGPAITMHGNATVSVPSFPPIPQGQTATVLSWSESSY
jgi:hypothetical protein